MTAALLLLALLQGGTGAGGATTGGVQRGVAVLPETVTVGDPFRVTVRVRAPAGAAIVFPEGPDTSAAIEALDPRVVRSAPEGSVDQTATYRLVAWDVGIRPVALPDVVVRVAGAERRVALGDVRVVVRSVLPADSALRVPKPPRDVLDVPAPWWRLWLLLALLLAILGLLLWWWLRRRRRAVPAAEVADPAELAEREFARIEALGLLEAGERGRYVALVVEVLRDYLARRVAGAAASLTSTELLAVARGAPVVPLDRLAPLLVEADLVKFARRPVSADGARRLGREARGIVSDVERALVPAPAETAA